MTGHLCIATLHVPTAAAAAAAIPSCAGLADLVEIRLDAWWTDAPSEDAAVDDLVQVLDAAERTGAKLLATLRPKRQGGGFEGTEEVRVSLLVAAARAGFAAVDLENDHEAVGAVRRVLAEEGVDIILSDHRFAAAPHREEGLRRLQSMQDLDGLLDKIAYPSGALPDVLRALELTQRHLERNGKPCIAPYGNADASVRALLAVAGNHASYGHAPGAPPAISGQPALADIQATFTHWGLEAHDLARRPKNSPWLAVLGDPVRHSLSPRIHNAALRAAGRPERYGALVVPDSLPAMRLVQTISDRIGLHGASVTSPLKTHAAMVTQGDEAVQAIGAANCIRFRHGRAESTNTDATAAKRILEAHLAPGDTVAVLGAGGASRAIQYAAKQAGFNVMVCARNPPAAAPGIEFVPWAERADLRPAAWVQATTLGMDPDDETVLPVEAFEGAKLALELVYGHGPTPFQTAAAQAGATVVDGKKFLLEQAVDAYTYWTGDAPDRAAMEAALA